MNTEILLSDFSSLAVKGIITFLDTNYLSVFIPSYSMMLKLNKSKSMVWQIANNDACFNPKWASELNYYLQKLTR